MNRIKVSEAFHAASHPVFDTDTRLQNTQTLQALICVARAELLTESSANRALERFILKTRKHAASVAISTINKDVNP